MHVCVNRYTKDGMEQRLETIQQNVNSVAVSKLEIISNLHCLIFPFLCFLN